ncbi:MAG: prolyl oligopeptidase family serine peptidase [Planctomycetota bacterium]
MRLCAVLAIVLIAPLGTNAPAAPQAVEIAAPTSGNGTPQALGDEPREAPIEPPLPAEIPLREFLVLPRVDLPGRRVLHQDPIDAALAAGQWRSPAAGEGVVSAEGDTVTWQVAVADPKGRLMGPYAAGGYAVATVASPAPRRMLLMAGRCVAVWKDGAWLPGDVYGSGSIGMPVSLNEGENTLLFQLARPGFTAKLVEPPAPIALEPRDATLPDLVAGEEQTAWTAIPIVNATDRPLVDAELRISLAGKRLREVLPRIEAMSVAKVPIRLLGVRPEGEAGAELKLALHPRSVTTGGVSPDPAAEATLKLAVRKPTERRVCTLVSRVDGSVQAYSLVPATEPSDESGVVLALHDLGIDHAAFAKNFTPKPWAHVVVPQNRRPVGFVWEDWGARDAMEALADARRQLPNNARRVCLLGHGYGGYGARRLAMRMPDQFAALATVGAPLDFVHTPELGDDGTTAPPVVDLLERGSRARSTARLLPNLTPVATLAWHGADDKRTPLADARFVRARLGAFHADFRYRELPGAGHWWGKETVDSPEIDAFFQSRRTAEPKDIEQIDFTTAHPAEASRRHWVTIEQQVTAYQVSRVVLTQDTNNASFRGRTVNVRRLGIDLDHLSSPREVAVTLDDTKTLKIKPTGKRLWLERDAEGQWAKAGRSDVDEKTASRGGLLKSALNNRAVLVYGTRGTDEENAWAMAKARYDAMTFWRRGNGALEVLPDTLFQPQSAPNRNVVLYGNAKTNAAWPSVLSTSPVQLRSDRVDVGLKGAVRPEMGDGLALVMVRPRQGSTVASVAVVGGTGIRGMRMTDRLRYFTPGVVFPDLMILGERTLLEGSSDLRAAGYFGHDWNVGGGEILWRDLAL